MVYTFKPGKKISSPKWSASFLIGKTSKIDRIDFTYNIDESFLLTEEEVLAMGGRKKEWLKIGGITWYRGFLGWLFNHNNREALLFAVRHYKPDQEVVEVTPYVNNNYDWDNGPVGKVLPGIDNKARIERLSKGRYRLSMETLTGWISAEFEVEEDRRCEILPPWHGGRVPAQRRKKLKMAFDLN